MKIVLNRVRVCKNCNEVIMPGMNFMGKDTLEADGQITEEYTHYGYCPIYNSPLSGAPSLSGSPIWPQSFPPNGTGSGNVWNPLPTTIYTTNSSNYTDCGQPFLLGLGYGFSEQ